jgi:hypothetical protein
MEQGSIISTEEGSLNEPRCELCSSLMCSFKYKHNGIDKVGYRCPSPHGLRTTNRKDLAILQFPKLEDIDAIL